MTIETTGSPAAETTAQKIGRMALGLFMTFAGIGHVTFAREEFRAQVPTWVPGSPDVTVLASGPLRSPWVPQ